MNDDVPDGSWVSVATYNDTISPDVTAGLLSSMGIPAGVNRPPRSYIYYVVVPPERLPEAKAVVDAPPIPDDELTRLALSEPPEDP